MPRAKDPAWFDQVKEEIIDPDRRIVDPHHHLWSVDSTMWGRYELDDLWSDTESGHRIEKTVFLECRSNYREVGPEHLRPIGETEYVVSCAAESARAEDKATIAGIVGFADLTLGALVSEVLDAHEAAAPGLFKGIRHAGPEDKTGTLTNPGGRFPDLYSREDFRDGVRLLGRRGYPHDTWHFHHQNRDYLALARACPDTVMVLDHLGTPAGAGAYEGMREEIFPTWKEDIAAIAECENVVAKLGGLAMPDNGFGWDERDVPPTSDEFVEAQAPYYHHMIDCFGPERCMFESNFPVDKLSISYHVLWNGLKNIVADFSEDEKHAMFYATAARVYRLD